MGDGGAQEKALSGPPGTLTGTTGHWAPWTRRLLAYELLGRVGIGTSKGTESPKPSTSKLGAMACPRPT